jgi:hypothetical protein
MALYEPKWASFQMSSGTTLSGAIANREPADRVAIAMQLLDDGADPSVVNEKGDNVNVLHVLFSQRKHDFELEAPLLRRLLEGGADPNLRSPRFNTPLVMFEALPSRGEEARPFYDPLFAHPNLDFDVVVVNSPERVTTLRDRVLATPETSKPEFRRRMLEYEAARGVDAGW